MQEVIDAMFEKRVSKAILLFFYEIIYFKISL